MWIYSYNSTYPVHFIVDPRNITPKRPYRLGDLVNTFPEGILLHPKYKRLIHTKICTIDQDAETDFLEGADAERFKI